MIIDVPPDLQPAPDDDDDEEGLAGFQFVAGEEGDDDGMEEGVEGEGEEPGPPPPDQSVSAFGGHSDSVDAVAWSPGAGGPVASGGGDDRAFLLLPPTSAAAAAGAAAGPLGFGFGGAAELAGHGDSVAAVAFSADGSLLATGGLEGKVLVWSVAPAAAAAAASASAPAAPAAGTLTPLAVLEGPSEGIEWLAWHPRGHVLLAGSEDATTWMWQVGSSGGTFMQVGGRGRPGGGLQGGAREPPSSLLGVEGVREGRGGSTLADASPTSLPPGRPLPPHPPSLLQVFAGHATVVSAGGFSSDGRTVVTVSGDATLRAWSPKVGAG